MFGEELAGKCNIRLGLTAALGNQLRGLDLSFLDSKVLPQRLGGGVRM